MAVFLFSCFYGMIPMFVTYERKWLKYMRICSLASGSSGNCLYVGDGKHHILIDAGISRKRIVDGLARLGVRPQDLDGIFVTHEHSDHIQGIPMLVKMFDIPVYATAGTLDAIRQKDKKGVIRMDHLYQLYPDQEITMGSLDILPFHSYHDAMDPVCYSVHCGRKKMSIATDLGKFDDYIVDHLMGSEVLFLEANHDISMLETGPYPYPLKQRILGDRGHLSNEDSGRLLSRLADSPLKYTFLAHLSKENNYPELAYESVKCQLWEELGLKKLPFEMEVARRDDLSTLITL